MSLYTLSSAVRWSLFALSITLIILLAEGSGMLSKLTEGHPRVRTVMGISAIVLLIFTVYLTILGLANPTQDTTASQLADIQRTLEEVENTLNLMQQTLQQILGALR